MIDFTNAAYVKLNERKPADAHAELAELLLPDERVLVAFRGMRDSVTFTTKRLVAVNVQGMTGKKKDYTSLPYSRVQAFSVETAGTFDRDTELELWFSGLGLVKLEFGAGVDIRGLSRLLAERCL
ncbi:MAG: PH domain-containing protein [Cellulomonas sp.]|jgi:Bacterial PH domain|uniref:PH domain-containing protein n=1 Tax=Cellulomonas sp. TaxID=40001 RepID=UPI0019EDDB6A|nr:PH domain-containing protein [Cellulomonas sp.]MBF0689662.1 PH domain-containing protein [Cellulomonas sp.]